MRGAGLSGVEGPRPDARACASSPPHLARSREGAMRMNAESPAVMLPERLGRCRLLAVLGAGSFGTVYRAELTRGIGPLAARSIVAVKVLRPEISDDEGVSRRFEREASLGTRIHHSA